MCFSIGDTAYYPQYQASACNFNINLKASELNSDLQFQIFPNPAHTVLQLKTSLNQLKSIDIYNSLGIKIALEYTVNKGEYVFQIGSLPKGLYFICFEENGILRNAKFVKE